MEDKYSEENYKVVAQRGNIRLILPRQGPYVLQEFVDNQWKDPLKSHIYGILCKWIIDDEKLIKNLSTTLLQEGETNI